MTAQTVFIGLDAGSATLIERLIAEGDLPNLATHLSQAQSFDLDCPLETLPGAIWPELTTGRPSGEAAVFYHPSQLRTGEAILRPLGQDEIDRSDLFWVAASDAGCRVCVVDIPQAPLTDSINGSHVVEWGLHDRAFGTASFPRDLIDELEARYGRHPVSVCDLMHGRSPAGYEATLDALIDGVERRTDMLLDLMARDAWDLFACGYGETHCVGHQFWHFQDPTHPRHVAVSKRLQGAIAEVYRRIDDGVGRLIEAAGPDANVVVLASHGMGPKIAGPQLLPEVLARLGFSDGSRSRLAGALRWLQNRDEAAIRGFRRLVRLIFRRAGVRAVQARIGALRQPFESAAALAAALPNNRCGAIRFNLKGREPFGRVAPGAELQTLVERLEQELCALVDLESGEPIVDRVITAEDAFGPNHHPDVPDLIVVFRTDLGPIDACRSDAVGTISLPSFKSTLPRTGDHWPDTRAWIGGPGVDRLVRRDDGRTTDLAATLLFLLGVEAPEGYGGRSLFSVPGGMDSGAGKSRLANDHRPPSAVH